MKLRLIFEGDEPISINLVSDVFTAIDKKLFSLEKKRLKPFQREFPFITNEQLAACRRELNKEYQAKHFTMLQVESVETGSIILIAGVSGAVLWFLEKTLGATVTEAWKETGMHRRIKRFWLMGQKDTLIQSVRDVAFDYYKKNAVDRLIGNATIESIKFPSLKWKDNSLEVSMGKMLYHKADTSSAHSGSKQESELKPKVKPEPAESLVVRDMEVHEPVDGPNMLDVRIERIVVKVPPITYSKLADDYNRGE